VKAVAAIAVTAMDVLRVGDHPSFTNDKQQLPFDCVDSHSQRFTVWVFTTHRSPSTVTVDAVKRRFPKPLHEPSIAREQCIRYKPLTSLVSNTRQLPNGCRYSRSNPHSSTSPRKA
jgi:hypothetical protein